MVTNNVTNPGETAKITDPKLIKEMDRLFDDVCALHDGSVTKSAANEGSSDDEPEPKTERMKRTKRTKHARRDDPPSSGLAKREEEPPAPLSALAVRLTDGALFVSIEDANDCILAGRIVVPFLRLTDEEVLRARHTMTETLDDVAANIIGRLPRRST